MEVSVADCVFEVGDVAGAEEWGAVAVFGFAYQELEREGVGVVAAGVLLGAFSLCGSQRSYPHDHLVT